MGFESPKPLHLSSPRYGEHQEPKGELGDFYMRSVLGNFT